MHPNESVWVLGGLQPEFRSVAREREHLIALRESRRSSAVPFMARLRGIVRPRPVPAGLALETDLACCAA
jgi:hypothetical protein